MTHHRLSKQLESIVTGTPWLMHALEVVARCSGAQAFIGAGAVRNVVWDRLHGIQASAVPSDIDVVFFDAADEAGAGERELLSRLRESEPALQWEVTNQAYVHVWYREKLGYPLAAFESVEEAVGAWPETATAIAVRLGAHGALELVAPRGLDDLFGLVLRPNPHCRDRFAFEHRLKSKQFLARWPRLRLPGLEIAVA